MVDRQNSKNLKYSFFLFLLLFLCLFFSCISSSFDEPLPDWVLTEPYADKDGLFYVESVLVSSSSPLAAYNKLETLLVNQLLAEVGGTRRAFLEEIARDYLEDLVRIALNRKLTGIHKSDFFYIEDIYYGKRKSEIKKIFILAHIDFSFALKLKKRLASVDMGRNLLAWSIPSEIFKVYRELAIMAASYEVEANFPIAQKYLDKCVSLLNSFSVEIVKKPEGLYLFEPILTPYILKVMNSSGDPISGFPFSVFWRDVDGNRKLIWRSRTLNSDRFGLLRFLQPPLRAREGATVGFEFPKYLLTIPEKITNKEIIKSFRLLKKSAASLSISLSAKIFSRAKEKKIGVLIVELDSAGNITNGTSVSDSIVAQLNKRGFKTVFLNPSNFSGLDIGSSFGMMKKNHLKIINNLPKEIDQVVYGSASLISFKENKNLFDVSVNGDVTVYSRGGLYVYQTESSASSRGNNSEVVLNLAWRSFGKNLAQNLILNLP